MIQSVDGRDDRSHDRQRKSKAHHLLSVTAATALEFEAISVKRPLPAADSGTASVTISLARCGRSVKLAAKCSIDLPGANQCSYLPQQLERHDLPVGAALGLQGGLIASGLIFTMPLGGLLASAPGLQCAASVSITLSSSRYLHSGGCA